MAKSDVTRTLALIDAEIEKLTLTRELVVKLDAMAQPVVTETKPRKPRGKNKAKPGLPADGI
jgi:hypothetical protein